MTKKQTMFNTTQKIKAWAPRILIKNQGWTQVLRNDKHFLLHNWRPSCYSSKKKRWYARDGCEALGIHSYPFYFIFNTWVHKKMDLFAFPIIHFSSLHIRWTNMKSLPKIIYMTSILYHRYSDNEQTQNSTNQICYIQR